MQAVYPLLSSLGHHRLEVMSFCLEGKVIIGPFFRGERCSCFKDDRLIGLTIEGEPSTKAIDAKILDFIVGLQQIMPLETSLFSPTLIDAMHRVVAIYGFVLIAYFEIALLVIAIVIQYDMYRSQYDLNL